MAETPSAHAQASQPITRYDIITRRPHPHIFGEPADMGLAGAGSVEPGEVDGLALPYCIDLAAQRALYTVTAREDLDALFGAPFLYAAQLRLARAVLGVPYTRLADMAPADGLHPVLVFSPGRAGSTLLARMLSGIGRLSASEPDVLTQLATLSPDMRAALPSGTEAALVNATVAGLARHCGRDVVVKLRSQCNAGAARFMEALPYARAVFLFRRSGEWAMSRHRSFATEKPALTARMLRQAVIAVDQLVRMGRNPVIVWYEDLVAHPTEVLLKILAHSPLPLATMQESLAAAMASDSQEGSGLARTRLRGRSLDPGFLEAFQDEWITIAPKLIIERYGLDALLRV
jgi:LPS sulfotransferase NodH